MHTPWVEVTMLALDEADDEVVVAVLRDLGAPVADTVSLLAGDLEPEEAVAFARVLVALGRAEEAREVIGALVDVPEPLAAAM